MPKRHARSAASMHDPHYFPEAQEQLVEVQGLIVPESMQSLVQFGWLAAVAYVALLTGNFVYFLVSGLPPMATTLGIAELLLLAAMALGMRRWRFAPTLLICIHPIYSIIFHGAGIHGLPLLGGMLGYLQLSATVLIVALVGQAAKFIRAARLANTPPP